MAILRVFPLHKIGMGRPSQLYRSLCGKANAPRPDVDVYHQLQNLDFKTAAKILFTTPPNKKKFGLDFHLVQLFFACMPSLAVYLVAQYARYEIRRMEAEVELKKKQAKEVEEAKQLEDLKRKEDESMDMADSELLKVKVRLDALEETVKEIVDDAKKLSGGSKTKDQESSKKEQPMDKVGSSSDKDGEVQKPSSGISMSPEPNQHHRRANETNSQESGK